jgi:uncharacterized protein YqhQ
VLGFVRGWAVGLLLPLLEMVIWLLVCSCSHSTFQILQIKIMDFILTIELICAIAYKLLKLKNSKTDELRKQILS